MKTRLVIITICLAVAVLGVQAKVKVKDEKAITGKSLTQYGSYSISKADVPMQIKGQDVKTYELVYENSSHSVLIGVNPSKKCTNFIVKSGLLEIEYQCNKGVFGVKKINEDYAEISKDINEAVLDRSTFFMQKVISQTPQTEEELLGLIACYFPNLIKEEYKAKF